MPKEIVAIRIRLENDDVRRRRASIGLDGGERATHVDLDVRLLHAAIGDRIVEDLRDLGGLAERLDRNPGDRGDLLDLRIG